MESHIHTRGHRGGRWGGALDPLPILERAGLRPGMSLLDLGSGAGRFSIPAAGVASRVHAIDISEDAVRSLLEEASRLGLGNLTASVGDAAGDLGFDGEFDMVLLANVLHGFVVAGTADRVLENARRALRPGGRVLVLEFKKDSPSPPGPPSYMRIREEDLIEIASRHGLEPIDRFEAGPHHYAVVFQRKS
ncbi:MAG: class I SAM-dependent methyltransferase [Nitrososphaeria archaeon]